MVVSCLYYEDKIFLDKYLGEQMNFYMVLVIIKIAYSVLNCVIANLAKQKVSWKREVKLVNDYNHVTAYNAKLFKPSHYRLMEGNLKLDSIIRRIVKRLFVKKLAKKKYRCMLI